MNPFDYGVLFGVGYQSRKKLGVEFLADWGFRNIIKKEPDKDYFSDNYLNGKNLIMTVGIYYLFEINKGKLKQD